MYEIFLFWFEGKYNKIQKKRIDSLIYLREHYT